MALPAGARAAAVVLLLCGGLASPAAQQPPAAPPAPAHPASAQTVPATAVPAIENPAADGPTLPSDPERIRRALARPATLLPAVTTIEVEGTTFRVNVNQKPFDVWRYWGPKDTAVSSNVRSWYFSNWHHEYLRMVTPDYGRRAALYPSGMLPSIPIIPTITNMIERALKRRAERMAKEEVRQALEDFFAQHPEARAPAPSPPPPPVIVPPIP